MNYLPVGDVQNVVDNFLFNWTDVKVAGLRNAVIDNIKINMELKTIRVLFHSTLNMRFNYVLDGMLLSVFPVSGTGKGELILTVKLPDRQCSLQNSTCLTRRANIVKTYFLGGIPEYGNIKLDKLMIDDVEINKFGLMYTMKNVEVEGLKNAVIDNLSIDMDLKIMRISIQTDFVISSDYAADGVLLSIPVVGKGRSNTKMNDIKLEMLIMFDIIKNPEGKKYMQLQRYFSGFDVIGDIQFNYANAFNNDEKKSKKLHSFLNECWRTIITNFGPQYFEKITDKIYSVLKFYWDSQYIKEIQDM
ncbi:jg2545 [Pararge aegeria aegeria]|uniref:Jg2545 protein n=1 Tax=Pararge aegeria aegeria TaxID=348720 RepID=A0A8S4R1L2_9NEOP|nr:jg2545 [Pararge aegeria aegeria]